MHDLDYNQENKRSNIGGLIGLFAVFVAAGFLASWLYLGLIDLIPIIYLNFIIAVGFGLFLSKVIEFTKKGFKIFGNTAPLIIVIVGLVIIHFFKWQMFFGMYYWRIVEEGTYWWFERSKLMPLVHIPEFFAALRWILGFSFDPANQTNIFVEFINDFVWFNEVGTYSIFDRMIIGLPLAVIWVGELIIISIFPILSASSTSNVYLSEKDTWAKPKYVAYCFEEFNDEELMRIKQGHIDVILNKPLADAGLKERVSKIAFCYLGSDETEYIAVCRAGANSSDTEKKLALGKHVVKATARLDSERINALKEGLVQKHGEMVLVD